MKFALLACALIATAWPGLQNGQEGRRFVFVALLVGLCAVAVYAVRRERPPFLGVSVMVALAALAFRTDDVGFGPSRAFVAGLSVLIALVPRPISVSGCVSAVVRLSLWLPAVFFVAWPDAAFGNVWRAPSPEAGAVTALVLSLFAALLPRYALALTLLGAWLLPALFAPWF